VQKKGKEREKVRATQDRGTRRLDKYGSAPRQTLRIAEWARMTGGQKISQGPLANREKKRKPSQQNPQPPPTKKHYRHSDKKRAMKENGGQKRNKRKSGEKGP